MKQQRVSFCILVFLLSTVSLFAAREVNSQKIYPVDSPFYEALEYLYISQGLSLPSTAGPWSGDELSLMLSRIEKSKLNADERTTYQYVSTELGASLPSFSIGATVALESYLHTNITDFTENNDWYYNYDKRSPLVSVPLEISLAGKFYAFSDIELKNKKYNAFENPVNGSSSLYGTYAITTNAYNFWQDEPLSLDGNVPYRAFASFGGEGWGFEIGRDQLSWGPGTTGNFLLGKQVEYHNQGRFTAYGKNFKYTFVTSFFPHPDEIWDSNQNGIDDNSSEETTAAEAAAIAALGLGVDVSTLYTAPSSYSQGRSLVGLKMFMAHRFEWRLFDNKLGIALNEGIMYQSEEGNLDLRVLNPFMIYHNYVIRSNANSIASLELDYTPFQFWNIYSQLVVDEYAFGSVEQNLPSGRHPNAVGFMFGVKTVRPAFGGMFYANLEGVYTDPYLYLRSEDGDSNQSNADSSDTLNFVVAIRRWLSSPDRVIYDQSYMGYQYGGDSIVGNLVAGFKKYNDWSMEGRLFAMVDGPLTMDSLWEKDRDGLSPSGNSILAFNLGVSGSKMLSSKWELTGGIDFLSVYNDSTFSHDLQLNMGMSYCFK
ncbi:hypothetical protein SpiGrapes_1082 [Sphaerochaeta pleomorpha str. Grapes]|uniref:Capsule assembly protein Wzi n=1 Tax=Sphaerochaeta pleomorpha (strain ATCC BAA-1885 / DSM 22778 / Grapes) TaxID=158190 RepID=G8QS44_SPHPG|nr:hypothetical protein [Sphaerochaeta pleomorpha]AEV28905.1 hypothetical protein SpiGrapes_1082 [Sphaerochaeta pleomorpha str. Grapes]